MSLATRLSGGVKDLLLGVGVHGDDEGKAEMLVIRRGAAAVAGPYVKYGVMPE